jgi:hypothetical protein
MKKLSPKNALIQRIGKKRRDNEQKRKKKKIKIRKTVQLEKTKIRRWKKTQKIECPTNFSFVDSVDNANKIIKYFWGYEEIFQEWYWAEFDLRPVQEMSFDALSLLVVKIRDSNFTNNKPTKGRFPRDKKINNLIAQSGFWGHRSTPEESLKDLSWGMHWHYTKEQYDPILCAEVTDIILNHSFWGESDETIQGIRIRLYPLIMECMFNTQDHAGKWFNRRVTYYKDENKVTKICFIDMGEWILNTLNAKIKKLSTRARLALAFTSTNSQILKALLDGAIGSLSLDKYSVTEKKERGKGLPSMKEFSKESFVKDFTIITNDVYANISNSKYKTLSKDFDGTFIYWEIHHPTLNLTTIS